MDADTLLALCVVVLLGVYLGYALMNPDKF